MTKRLFFLYCLCGWMMTGCSEPEKQQPEPPTPPTPPEQETPIVATDLQIDPKAYDLIVDETLQIQATILPENAENQTIVWTSSDPMIATVSDQGEVKAVKAGKATITAQLDSLTTSCELWIWNPCDHQLNSSFFESHYWEDYYQCGNDNYTLTLGSAAHDGMFVTGPGEYILLSVMTPKAEDPLTATLVPGDYLYDESFSLAEMTIVSRGESIFYVYQEDTDGDGYMEEENYQVINARLAIRQIDEQQYKLVCEMELNNGETYLVQYEGVPLFQNRYEQLLPSMINNDRDFTCGFGEAFYLEDGTYKLDLMQGGSPYEGGGWMNRHRVNLFLHTVDNPDRIEPGTYTIAASPLEEGYLEQGGYVIQAGNTHIYGSHYFWMSQQTMEATYGFLQEGTLTISYEGENEDTFVVELDATDINGHRIHLTYKGAPILTESV